MTPRQAMAGSPSPYQCRQHCFSQDDDDNEYESV